VVGRFRIIAGITTGAVVFLILVGALVRMTGSGMGCPDWPQCFGQWIPPTELSQLPADYKQRFAVAGREIADFDAFKTWVEYVNRLIGVLIGLFSVATVVAAWFLRKRFPASFWLSVGGLLGVVIVAGVGAYVVRTHLAGSLVTLHMILALSVLGAFIAAYLASWQGDWNQQAQALPVINRSVWGLGLVTVVLVLAQIVLGTQVRESVDVVAAALGENQRDSWISQLGTAYDIHQLSYYSVVVAMLAWGWYLRPWLTQWGPLRGLYLVMFSALGGEIMLGLGMHHLGIPAWMQPTHLLLATLLFGSSFALLGTIWLLRRAQLAGPLLVHTKPDSDTTDSVQSMVSHQ
jgi:cytochrome c oxidase assembly protein subunit 15